ncbi:MAG: hypothetical protein PHP10_03600 [Candidatus Omnitrophica bacterium]|nr:hypothetical protein [Candidatus Omnitrophota bacterium]
MKCISAPPARVDDITLQKIAGVLSVKASYQPLLINPMVYGDTRFKVIDFTRNTATDSGTQAITGVGFAPKAVIFFSCVNTTSRMSVGIDNGAGSSNRVTSDYAAPGTWLFYNNNQSIKVIEASGAEYTGYISALGADGFTITWTKTGAPTGTLNIGCIVFR